MKTNYVPWILAALAALVLVVGVVLVFFLVFSGPDDVDAAEYAARLCEVEKDFDKRVDDFRDANKEVEADLRGTLSGAREIADAKAYVVEFHEMLLDFLDRTRGVVEGAQVDASGGEKLREETLDALDTAIKDVEKSLEKVQDIDPDASGAGGDVKENLQDLTSIDVTIDGEDKLRSDIQAEVPEEDQDVCSSLTALGQTSG